MLSYSQNDKKGLIANCYYKLKVYIEKFYHRYLKLYASFYWTTKLIIYMPD